MDSLERIAAVIFSKSNAGGCRFLILHRCLNWKGWELLKGQVEQNESKIEALVREIFEETGLKNVQVVKQLNYSIRFFDKVKKKWCQMTGFLVQADDGEPISLDHNAVKEHDDFLWADQKTVLSKLRFDNMKNLFLSAVQELSHATAT